MFHHGETNAWRQLLLVARLPQLRDLGALGELVRGHYAHTGAEKRRIESEESGAWG